MEQAEAEMLRKEEENQRDLLNAIGLEDFLNKKDFSEKGLRIFISYVYYEIVICLI